MIKRLEKVEIAELRVRLSEWQSPKSMGSLVEEVLCGLGGVNFFNQGGLAFLREAWFAARFATARKAEAVRLVSAEWPDFELLIADHVEQFEAVEADDPARRRGDEYRKSTEDWTPDPVRNWVARAKAAPEWIRIACQRKVEKRYSGRCGLAIYLSNVGEYGLRQTQVEVSFKPATEFARDVFDSVWVLWKARAYRVWP